ncbi:acyl-CoA desaturase [Roseiconus nitratireducens]|nr:acyl-CoA desaturase [Roseiconus nitratireducens]
MANVVESLPNPPSQPVAPDAEELRGGVGSPQTAPNSTKAPQGQTNPELGTAAQRKRFSNLSWWAIGWLGLAHLVVICVAPFTFTLAGLAVAVVLHWLTGSIGICLGYHRLLTHSGMKTSTWFKYVLAGVGSLAGEGTPLDWVADHRKHHKHSDQDGDPHSPHDGGWWSHMFWLAFHTHNGDRDAYLQRWVPDLYKLRGMRIMDYLFLPIHLLSGVILFGAGYLFGGVELGTSLLVWGLFVRLVFVLHATWMVNSASHIWGYKNYETTDDSRNNWLVAIVAYGEGWHNNHHAHPRMAKHGHKWWEFDITWQAIRLFRKLGLVWDVVDYRTAAEKKAREQQPTSAA